MNVALYIRRSTNERMQADSLRVQEEILRAHAKGHGMAVVRVFRDSASGTSIRRRTGFLQMVQEITHAKAFDAVLVRDVSRFGRFFDSDEAAFWETVLLGHGVRTIYVEEVFQDDRSPMATLIKSVRRVMAAEYSRDKSRMIRYAQSRGTRLGFRCAGGPPLGLRRVMVKSTGEFVQDLAHGEWKGLANRRTTLAPGHQGEVEVVRSIFEMYGDEKLECVEIARRLNADGIPSPEGVRWQCGAIMRILQNPAYIGTARYTTRWHGIIDPLPEQAVADLRVLAPGSFEGIIDSHLWNRVQSRWMARTSHRSDSDLATDLRRAYVAHGQVEARMLGVLPEHCSWGTYSVRFRHPDEALRLAYAPEIAKRTVETIRLLGQDHEVSGEGAHVCLDGVFRFSILGVFLHATRWGAHWRVARKDFEGCSILAFGVYPDGRVTDEWVLVRKGQIECRERAFSVSQDAMKGKFSSADLSSAMNWTRYLHESDAESAFLDAVKESSALSLAEVGRRLGWPHHVVCKIYQRLIAAGVHVPPLKRQPGRRLEVVCVRCGKSRLETPSAALALRSDLCLRCTHNRPRVKIPIECPVCGRKDERWPSSVAKLANGAHSLCKRCSNVEIGRLRKARGRPPRADR